MGSDAIRSEPERERGRTPVRPRRRPIPGWGWAVVAAFATALAVFDRFDLPVAAALAAFSVLAAGLIVASSLGPRPPAVFEADEGLSPPLSDVRDALLWGQLGREDLVFLLDRIERTVGRPELPFRRPDEVRTIVTVQEAEFLRYLEWRVAALEGGQ
jgi:hypothetical protein